MRHPHLLLIASAVLTSALPALRGARAESEQCGPSTCSEGTSCCNRGCGICAAPGEACITLFCRWGRPNAIDASEAPTTNVYNQVGGNIAIADSKLRFAGADYATRTGISVRAQNQHLVSSRTAYRFGATASTLVRGQRASGDERFGWALDVGATRRLPSLERILGSSLTLDAELMDGPVAGDSLAADSFAATRRATLAGGLAIEDMKNVVPLTAHARYLRTRVTGRADRSMVDIGVAASSNLDWIFWRGGRPFPFGVRLSYGHVRETSEGEFREHEISGGLYYFGRDKARIGIDFEASYQRYSEDLKARRLGAMLRIDYYWDANH